MDPVAVPSEIQALVRHAFRASEPIHSTDKDGFAPQGDKRFKKLIEGIQYSQKFVISYQLVLIGLLFLFTAIHWGSRLRAWRRRRNRINGRYEIEKRTVGKTAESKGVVVIESTSRGSSSSSSTLQEDFDPKTGACLAYQPRPIPIVNKTLPTNGTTLMVLAFLGLQVFYTFYNISLSLPMLFVFADRTSLVFVANLPLLYLFAAKNQPIKRLTGYSYESLNVFHRRLGEVMCLLALLHSAGMIGVWYTVLQPAGITLMKFLLIRMILLGIGAFVAYESLYFTSLGSFRQRWYELFLGVHIVLQVAALILVWFHHRRSRWYVGVALAIFLIDRPVYRFFVKATTVRASLKVHEDRKTVVLRAPVSIQEKNEWAKSIFGAGITSGWKATQHVFLTVPSLARKHIVQAHPFTIASKAPTADEKEASLELIIRAQNGFSGDLVRYAERCSTVTTRLDGPYGSQTAVELLQDSEHAVIVAGGSGIAVAWPLVWSVIDRAATLDAESLISQAIKKKILFVWIIRERSHISWLGQEKLEELRARGVTLKVPAPTSDYGHPDIATIIGEWINDIDDQTCSWSKIGVVASGPDSMNRAVRNLCSSLLWKGRDVIVEVEKFGW
ncbi:ferric reductase like transmembrane component-domain-containing protein [Usnea florida]